MWVVASPSDKTNSGRAIREAHPDSTGSLGIAISEAVEDAATHDDTNYALGSVLGHVLLHQSVIIVVAYAVLSAFTMPALPGFVLVSVGSLLATVAIYEAVVKRTNVTRFLFGMKPLPARARSEHPRARARGQVNATAGRVQES